MSYRFGVIGLGRVGGAMLALLKEAGHVPVWTVSARSHSNDIPVYAHIPDSPGGVQVVFIAVPDSHIRRVAAGDQCSLGPVIQRYCLFSLQRASHLRRACSTVHVRGGHRQPPSPTVHHRCGPGTADPSRGASSPSREWKRPPRVARELVDSIGAVMMTITQENKVLYHTSAVVASNYLVALLHQASVIIDKVGMGLNHLMPLIKGTLSNIEEHGSKAALTGPIARGDWATVEGHVKALREHFPDLIPSYIELGRYCARLAERHVSGRTLQQSPSSWVLASFVMHCFPSRPGA